jgi:hypothetical protein
VQATLGKLLQRLGREPVSSLLGQRSRGSLRNRAKMAICTDVSRFFPETVSMNILKNLNRILMQISVQLLSNDNFGQRIV